jgi:serine/threonine protein kinase
MPQIGQSVAHYRILDKLGAGGMGEVYRAQDTNLNRQVAIKVLSDRSAATRKDWLASNARRSCSLR